MATLPAFVWPRPSPETRGEIVHAREFEHATASPQKLRRGNLARKLPRKGQRRAGRDIPCLVHFHANRRGNGVVARAGGWLGGTDAAALELHSRRVGSAAQGECAGRVEQDAVHEQRIGYGGLAAACRERHGGQAVVERGNGVPAPIVRKARAHVRATAAGPRGRTGGWDRRKRHGNRAAARDRHAGNRIRRRVDGAAREASAVQVGGLERKFHAVRQGERRPRAEVKPSGVLVEGSAGGHREGRARRHLQTHGVRERCA